VPHHAAQELKICEVNIHVYCEGTKNAVDKLIFRDFLMAEEGKILRAEYGRVKLDLMERLEKNELSVSQYSRSKNEIVSQILAAAKTWKAGDMVIHRTSSQFVLSPEMCKKEEPESYSEDSFKIQNSALDGSVPSKGPGTGGSVAPKMAKSRDYYGTRSGLSPRVVL